MTEQEQADAPPGEPQDIGRHYWGYGIGLLALAWFAAPLVRYADAVELARCGLTAFIVVLCLEQSHKAASLRIRQLAFGAFVGAALMTVVFAGQIFLKARELAWHNDQRCLVIEREMLRGTPRRDDLAEVFEAFGCRPQSNAAIRRPASSPVDAPESLSSISGGSLAP